MNYCSIQDAWGNSISNTFNKYMDNKKQVSNLEKPISNTEKPISNTEKPISNSESNNITEHFKTIYNCNDFFLHLQKCNKCQAMVSKYNNNTDIVSYLYKLSNQNKDFIILGLLVLFILLFINLVNNLTKN